MQLVCLAILVAKLVLKSQLNVHLVILDFIFGITLAMLHVLHQKLMVKIHHRFASHAIIIVIHVQLHPPTAVFVTLRVLTYHTWKVPIPVRPTAVMASSPKTMVESDQISVQLVMFHAQLVQLRAPTAFHVLQLFITFQIHAELLVLLDIFLMIIHGDVCHARPIASRWRWTYVGKIHFVRTLFAIWLFRKT